MSNSGNPSENNNPPPQQAESNTSTAIEDVRNCATYTFPDQQLLVRSPESRGHLRSVSHGGGTSSTVLTGAPGGGGGSAGGGRPSALKGSRGHQRALSQGQISDSQKSVNHHQTKATSGHSRVGSKTDFILPPGHKESDNNVSGNSASKSSTKGGPQHSRQASRSESIYTLRRTAPPPLWRRFVCVLLRRNAKCEQDEERYRIVVPNHIVPPKTPRKEHPNGRRPDNRIRTTKYTLLSFLPRNLLEQFHRVANLYFIFIVLLNWFPAINAFGKEIAMIPVMFVLGVTALKDLFEDRRRHASDKRINNSTCRIYQSEAARYKKVLWKEVRVGDLIHLSNNEVVPADILLLRSSDPSGLCYIDTGHLDGETNLKQRQVARGFVEKQDVFEPSKFKSRIEVDAPTTKIYRFHGAIVHQSGGRVPVGTDNLLLRECLLKNTDFIEGIVVYAGHETKAMLNNGGPRYKRSSLERQMNLDVIWCVLILIVLCMIGAIGCKFWISFFKHQEAPFSSQYSEGTEAFLSFWTYIIILQIMIPLSLYVTLEMCKIIQVYHIHHNLDLYDPLMDKRTECRALNITEELGQIQYIFSDKTGTLTENRMIFRRCAIAGVDYNHPKLENEGKSGSLSVLNNPRLVNDLSLSGGAMSEEIFTSRQNHSAKIQEFLLLLAVCNTVVCSRHPHHDFMNASGIIEPVTTVFEESTNDKTMSHDKYRRLEESRSVTPSPPLNNPPNLTVPLVSVTKPIFEAESPDELALVDAAYNYNCRLVKRTPTSVCVDHFTNGRLNFEILQVLPFDSTRKRMSVIVRNPKSGELILYCKGADSCIFPYLSRTQDRVIIDKTQQHLNNYSRDGLRVLLMAKRVLSQREYDDFNKRQLEIMNITSPSDNSYEKKMLENFSRIENDLILLGATGIEDRLQEGVPETLCSLLSAGIVIWVLTGDKPETAINIAYSCKLFSPQMELLKLMTRSKETAESTIKFYLAEIEKESSDKAIPVPTTSTSAASRRHLNFSSRKSRSKALVIDGKTLTFILDRRANLTKLFLELTMHCTSVLCCRATPLQKAYIVKVVKEELKMRTLAIGDGANDVSMIQTADVGIGISGQEGMQAVMAADFALSRFKYLERLLLVHGHWSYDRLARMVLYFFYKNAAFVLQLFWYQLYCGFSGAVMIDQMYLMLFNLLFTSLPPLAIGVYDQDAPEDLLREKPYLYRKGRVGKVYKSYSFWLTMLDAVYQSLCIFFICLGAYGDSNVDIFEFGTTATTACMFVMLLHVAIDIRSWTIIHVVAIAFSIGSFYVYSLMYNSLCVNCFGLPSTYWIIQTAAGRYTYWAIVVLSCVIALLPRYLFRALKTAISPDDVTRALIAHRRANRRGEGFLVSWSRSTSTSSIFRTADYRPKNNSLTAVG